MVPNVDHRLRQNVVGPKIVKPEPFGECVTDVLTPSLRHLWSIIKQTLGNRESTCFI